MHELSIAQSIYEIVAKAVPPEQAGDVRIVRVRVGRSSGVVADSLDFCFGVVVSDTRLNGARLEIEEVPTVSECRKCNCRFEVEDLALCCPYCGSTSLALVSGMELQVAEVELLDDSVGSHEHHYD
jgi:hydrogenase nickel incorporation protein HypA/HybF